MLELLFALVILTIVGVYGGRLVRAMVRRLRFMSRLKKICFARKYRFRRIRNPLASFFRVGELPDFVISADKEYCVRLVTTIKRGRFFHFVDERYAASYTKGGIPLPMAKKMEEIRVGEKFHLFPEFKLPREVDGRQEVEPIMLFNPVPIQITTLNKNTNDISKYVDLVTSGGKIGQFTVYAGTAFCDLLENRFVSERKKNRWGE